MTAYVLARVEVTDWDVYKQYAARTPKTIAQFGGRFIARGAAPERLEGEQETLRIVVLEFPSVEQARAWYHSDAYQALKAMRENAGNGQFMILEGFSPEQWETALANSL